MKDISFIKYKRLALDSLIFALGSFGSKGILFFLVPIYTKYLTPQQYGTVEYALTFSQLLLPIVSCTIFDSILRYGLMIEYDKDQVFFNASVLFAFNSLTTFCICLFVDFPISVNNYKWYIFGHLISSFLLNNTLIFLKVKNLNKLYSVLNIFQALVLVTLTIFFFDTLYSKEIGFFLAHLISITVTAIIAIIYSVDFTKFVSMSVNYNLLKLMLYYSVPLIINNISWWIVHSSDKIMIDFYLGSLSLGLYTAASKIPSMLNLLISIFNQAWGISSIREYDSSNDNKFYTNVFFLFFTTLFFFCLLLLPIIPLFMKYYVSQSFFSSWIYVPILLIGACFSGISSFFGSLYSALKRTKDVMYTTLLTGVINLLLNFILIPKLGIMGAAIGTVMSYFFIALYRGLHICKKLPFYVNIFYCSKISLIVAFEAYIVINNYEIFLITCINIILFVLLGCFEFKKLRIKNKWY